MILGNHTKAEREQFIQDWLARNPGNSNGTTTQRYSPGRRVRAGKPKTYHAVRRNRAARVWAKKVKKEQPHG